MLSCSLRCTGNRLIDGRARPPGTLTLTSQRLWFFPHAWDAAPLSIAWEDLAEIRVDRPSIAGWGAIRGWPDELVLHPAVGQPMRVAVADPARFLDWIEDSDVPRYLHHD